MTIPACSKIDGPTVSIGMPVFNGEAVVAAAIESLLAQTYTDFELIISDNASTDATGVVCRRYAQQDSRIKYIRQAVNLGALQNFAYVLANASAQYFMWAGCDDRRAPRYLQSCLEILNEDAACVSVFSEYRVIDLTTGEEISKVTPTASASVFAFDRLFVRILDMSPALIYGLHRTEIIKLIGVGTYDWCDVFVGLALAATGRVHVIPWPLYMPGSKNGGTPYSVTGKRIDLWQFYVRSIKLLASSEGLSFAERLILISYVTSKCMRASISFYRQGY